MRDSGQQPEDVASTGFSPLAQLLGAGPLGPAAERVSTAARSLLEQVSQDECPPPRRVDELVGVLADEVGLDAQQARALLYLASIRDPALFTLPPGRAIETVVSLVCALGPADGASLWWRDPAGRLGRLAACGETGAAMRTERAAAAAAVAGAAQHRSSRRHVWAVSISTRAAALAYRCRPASAALGGAYAHEAAATLGPLLVLDDLLSRSADREQSLVESSERRLVRVGFDLHDGAMQDIAALAQEIRLFRAQLGTILESDPDYRRIAIGRVDDLEARLVALDSDLRQVAASLHSPTVLRLPFTDALEQEVAGFGAQAGVDFELRTSGDFEEMTSSQKIALLRVVQESLANVREHAGATRVTARLHGGRSRMTAEITDDGRGFNVEQRLAQAAHGGRLGLVGMAERIRLLGGRFDVESKAGGPTRIRASIPRWRPLGRAPAQRHSGETAS